MGVQQLIQHSTPFLSWLVDWHAQRPSPELSSILDDPARTAIVGVDVTNGFCYFGPLASPRVKEIVQPIAHLMTAAYEQGVRHFVMTHDAHDPQAVEFGQFPPHCIRELDESEPVPELKALSFWNEVVLMPKNSIDSALRTALDPWLATHPQLATFIVVGDCTDLCVDHLAMHLRLRANEWQLPGVRVIVPEDCVDTYEMPVDKAAEVGAMPHDAELLHLIYLYSLALNGVEVVKTLTPPDAQPELAQNGARARSN